MKTAIIFFIMYFMLAGLYSTALALDPGHSNPLACVNCHVLHNSLGGSLIAAKSNSNLCLSCHTSTGMAGKKPLLDNMKSTPGKSGTSHSWDAVVYNTERGSNYPSNSQLVKRLDPVIYGAATENSTDTTSVINLRANYLEDQFKDKVIQFYLFAVSEAGTATGGSTSRVEDSSKAWGTNQWGNHFITMKTGANAGQTKRIVSNTATVLSVDLFGVTVTEGDSYEILPPSYANNGLARKITKNTATALTFEALPVRPLKGDKYALMGSYKTPYEQALIAANKMTEKEALVTKFSCSTCHDQHLQKNRPWDPFSSIVYEPGKSNDRKFLRADNDKNQLCLDCHAERGNAGSINTRNWNGEQKSHPVKKMFANDASVSAGAEQSIANPAMFNPKPFKPDFSAQTGVRYSAAGSDNNPANNIVLDPDNRIQCLSCHGVHNADSTSLQDGTSRGDGRLLKREPGELCSACHKTEKSAPADPNALKMHNSVNTNSGKWGSAGWGVNNGKYGEFKCTTCHTAHGTKNIYLIRNNITAPDPSAGNIPGSAADFRYREGIPGTALGTMGDDTDAASSSTRICEVCHSRNKYHNYNKANNTANGGDLAHNNGTDCTACHAHKDGFRASCNKCHGNPPVTDTYGGPAGLVNKPNPTGSTTSGTHSLHADTLDFACAYCHYNSVGSGASHMNTKITIGFKDLFGNKSGGIYDGQPGVNYESSDAATTVTKNGTRTCSSVYCHGSGSPEWGGSLGAPCTGCHGFPPLTSAHAKHVQDGSLLTKAYGNTEVSSSAGNYSFGCGNCHPVTATKHVDGTIDVSLNPADGGTLKSKNNALAGVTGSGATTVCSKIYCHSNGAAGAGSNIATAVSPQWGGSFGANKCGSCHGNPPQYASAGAGVAGANSHYNATGFMGREGGHMITIHRDNVSDKVTGNGRLSTGTGIDNSHGNATAATTMACYVCHSATASSATIDTYAMDGTESSFKCSVCHTSDTTTKLQAGAISDKSKHVNGQPEVVFAGITMKSKAQLRPASLPAGWTRTGTYGAAGSYDSTSALLNTGTWTSGSKTCTVACHLGQTAKWGDTGVTCKACHKELRE